MNRPGRELDSALIVGINALAVMTIAVGAWMQASNFSPEKKRFSSGFTNYVIAIEPLKT